MKAEELINYLKCFNPEQEVVLFDAEAHPLKIKEVALDSANDGYFNHIVLSETDEM